MTTVSHPKRSVTTPPPIAATGVVKAYRRAGEESHVLDGCHLTVEAGEVVAIVGPSGSGKSTLLQALAGLIEVDDGKIITAGADLSTLTAKKRAQLRLTQIGFVFQFFQMLPTLSVAENIGLPIMLDGRRPGAEVKQWMARVGIEHRAAHLPSELSGGELQRAAIARAFINDPSVILADEPTGALDAERSEIVIGLLVAEARRSGVATVVVTHDSALVAAADRVLTLGQGRLG